MRRLRIERFLFPLTILVAIALDQTSKALVAAQFQLGQTKELAAWLAPVMQLTYVTNTGVAFGLFPGLGNYFIIVSAIVSVLVLLYYRQLPPGQPLTRISLGLLLSGALGNLIDRLARGSVVDFLDLNFWPLRSWPIFNLADSSIVAGVAIMTLAMILEELEPEVAET